MPELWGGAMDRFIARENIKHFRDLLGSATDCAMRSNLQKLLVLEENKLGASLELLADIDRHIADGNTRVERQQALVATMERDGHPALAQARTLLDGMRETLALHHRYRQRLMLAVRPAHDLT